MRIELGDGFWADVREIDDLRDADRVAVNGSWSYGVDPDTETPTIPGDADDKMRQTLARRIITAWNLQPPVPSKRPASLGELTLGQARKLYLGIQRHLEVIKGLDDNDPSVPGSDPTEGSAS